MTNLLAILHTTVAYQTAVVQLMMGEANFFARQAGLADIAPGTTNALVEFQVLPAPLGAGGSLLTTNHLFTFNGGKLTGVLKVDWLKRVSPPATNLFALAQRPSLLDTNGAYRLATQCLAALAVDVRELEKTQSCRVFQVPTRRLDAEGRSMPGKTNIVLSPVFQLSWGSGRPLAYVSNPVRMKILGTSGEILELGVDNPAWLRRPPLVVTNAAELLGPPPPPRHFVEQLFGGKTAYETVSTPERVEMVLLNQFSDEPKERLSPRSKPIVVKKAAAQRLSSLLLDFDSYVWTVQKACSPDFGVKLVFTREGRRVDVLFCFECDILEVTFNGMTRAENFDAAHDDLAGIVKGVFRRDARIQKLKTDTGSRQEAERTLQRLFADAKTP